MLVLLFVQKAIVEVMSRIHNNLLKKSVKDSEKRFFEVKGL